MRPCLANIASECTLYTIDSYLVHPPVVWSAANGEATCQASVDKLNMCAAGAEQTGFLASVSGLLGRRRSADGVQASAAGRRPGRPPGPIRTTASQVPRRCDTLACSNAVRSRAFYCVDVSATLKSSLWFMMMCSSFLALQLR